MGITTFFGAILVLIGGVWALAALGLWLVSRLGLGLTVMGFRQALIAALVIALLSAAVQGVLAVTGLRSPTPNLLGALLALLVAAAVLLAADRLLSGLSVEGVGGAIVATISVAAGTTIIIWLITTAATVLAQDTQHRLVFAAIVALRFFVPLWIPRYPLPAVLAALVIDGVDQTIFQTLGIDLPGYQGYDKALDIYYLTIAYIAAIRNWTHEFAFQVLRFLFYWRLVGVAAFELTEWRPLLLIFSNTFEYFFIFYESVRAAWDPRRMSRRLVLGAAAAILVFIKLPQEYWIHIAKLDATDVIKTRVLGASPTTPWGEAIAARPEIVIAFLVVVALLAVAVWRLARVLPARDKALTFAAEPLPPGLDEAEAARLMRAESWGLRQRSLLEKVGLVVLVTVIFAQVLPGIDLGDVELAAAMAVLVVLNTAVSHWLAQRGQGWDTAWREFLVMMLMNAGIVLYAYQVPGYAGGISLVDTLFFLLLLTTLVTLYDRYRPIQAARFAGEAAAARP